MLCVLIVLFLLYFTCLVYILLSKYCKSLSTSISLYLFYCLLSCPFVKAITCANELVLLILHPMLHIIISFLLNVYALLRLVHYCLLFRTRGDLVMSSYDNFVRLNIGILLAGSLCFRICMIFSLKSRNKYTCLFMGVLFLTEFMFIYCNYLISSICFTND